MVEVKLMQVIENINELYQLAQELNKPEQELIENLACTVEHYEKQPEKSLSL